MNFSCKISDNDAEGISGCGISGWEGAARGSAGSGGRPCRNGTFTGAQPGNIDAFAVDLSVGSDVDVDSFPSGESSQNQVRLS